MNWDSIAGNWKQITGKVKAKWGKLTDDDLTQINGNREQLEGKIQARYGHAKDQVQKETTTGSAACRSHSALNERRFSNGAGSDAAWN